MKRLLQIALTLLLMIGFSKSLQAQSDNASTDANATVEASITVTDQQTIEYGTLETGTDDGDNYPTTAGYFLVDGTASSTVDLSFRKTDLTTTSGSGGDQTLALTLATSGGTEDGTWEDQPSSDWSTASGTTNDFFLGDGTTATMPSDGDLYVWANPYVTLDGTEVPGSYTGSVTLTATYN
jgi:hypothetical protein